MTRRSTATTLPAGTKLRATLVGGYCVVVLVMLVSGFLLLQAIEGVREDAARFSVRQLQQMELLDRLMREQIALGDLLYSMVLDKKPHGTAKHRKERDRLRANIAVVTREARDLLTGDERSAWSEVANRAESLFGAIERSFSGRSEAQSEIGPLHHGFVASVARLLDLTQADARLDQARELQIESSRFRRSAALLAVAVLLAISGAIAFILVSLNLSRELERQSEVRRLFSLHILEEQELAARRFSQELHDEFGQTLNAIDATLSVVRVDDPESAARVEDAKSMVKASIANAREMSRLLRPTMLDDFGLDAGLRELARGFSQRTGIVVDYRSSLRGRLSPGIETHVFRIAQEALTNTSRHSTADRVEMCIGMRNGHLEFTITDNGGGFTRPNAGGGLGLIGMSERATAVRGRISVQSKPGDGVSVKLIVPTEEIIESNELQGQNHSR